MSVNIYSGNIFDSDASVICHQVNCRGKMGSGFAKQIRTRYPVVYEHYIHRYTEASQLNESLLGKVQLVQTPGKTVINMFSQDNYGYDGAQYTDYEAFLSCLQEIHKLCKGMKIAFPYKIGCGLGGGNWDIIQELIVGELGEDCEVEIWKL